MSDDALFDVFEQDEPSAIVEVTETTLSIQQTTTTIINDNNTNTNSKDKRILEEDDDDDDNQTDFNSKRSRTNQSMDTGTGR
ncbi:unnamed protein product [Rotaria sp. Silwood1]|nr:unnamed protein product [Rotaria sp. Silwood1]